MSDHDLDDALGGYFKQKELAPYRDIAANAIKAHNKNQLNKKIAIAFFVLFAIGFGVYYLTQAPKDDKKELIAQVLPDYPYKRESTRAAFEIDSVYAGYLLIQEERYNRAIDFLQQPNNEAKFYLAIAHIGNKEIEIAKSILIDLPQQKAKDLLATISK